MMNFYKITALSALAFGMTVAASAQVIAASSSFDTDDEGWQVREYNNNTNLFLAFDSPNYFATGGNPGGHISYTDTVPGAWWFYAPSKFLGDQSPSYGFDLSFDLKWTDVEDLGTNGPDVILYDGSTYLVNQISFPTNSWANYTVGMTETGWSKTDSIGDANLGTVTAGEFQTVLGNLQELRIRGDWGAPLGDTGNLDNVQLEAVPEPTTIAALGLGALALLRRRRNK